MSNSVLKVENISKSFGTNHVLKNLSFEVEEGQVIGLLGPSGGGKSVLLKILSQVLSPDSGHISLKDMTADDIGLMFQEGALFDSLTVFDNVAFPLVDGRVPSTSLTLKVQEEIAPKVMNILKRVGLGVAFNKYPAQLSGGMKRRASLARTLIANPKLLLLDDPTSGLDPIASRVIMELIQEIQQETKATTIIVSQDLRRLIPYVDQVIALFDGELAYYGDVCKESLADEPRVADFIKCRFDLPDTQQSIHP